MSTYSTKIKILFDVCRTHVDYLSRDMCWVCNQGPGYSVVPPLLGTRKGPRVDYLHWATISEYFVLQDKTQPTVISQWAATHPHLHFRLLKTFEKRWTSISLGNIALGRAWWWNIRFGRAHCITRGWEAAYTSDRTMRDSMLHDLHRLSLN